MYNKRLSKQQIAIAYSQRLSRTLEAFNVIMRNHWESDYLHSNYKSPVTYLRYRHGITWKEYYPAWGGIMYTKYGM